MFVLGINSRNTNKLFVVIILIYTKRCKFVKLRLKTAVISKFFLHWVLEDLFYLFSNWKCSKNQVNQLRDEHNLLLGLPHVSQVASSIPLMSKCQMYKMQCCDMMMSVSSDFPNKVKLRIFSTQVTVYMSNFIQM